MRKKQNKHGKPRNYLKYLSILVLLLENKLLNISIGPTGVIIWKKTEHYYIIRSHNTKPIVWFLTVKRTIKSCQTGMEKSPKGMEKVIFPWKRIRNVLNTFSSIHPHCTTLLCWRKTILWSLLKVCCRRFEQTLFT